MGAYNSWALRPNRAQQIVTLRDRLHLPALTQGELYLAYGNGRSYGDSCLNTGHSLIPMRGLNRFIEFDPQEGTLRCEAGVTLEEILRVTMPRGWFLPVTPGTQFVTVGGAVANDVHGKNHHSAGSFGCHVIELELVRSDGNALRCSPRENGELFSATIGGLGLTGLITWIALRLRRIGSSYLTGQTIKFGSLEQFLELSRQSDANYEYTVAWIDCLSSKGRGVFSRGNHAQDGEIEFGATNRLNVPLMTPISLVNPLSVRLMNSALYVKQPRGTRATRWHFQKFFYPLDSIQNWNRLYGPRGFYQFQCVLPMANALPALYEMLRIIARSRQGSFLAVLKAFGDVRSPGMMSFPRLGVTLAIDFPNAGQRTLQLMSQLECVGIDAAGAMYPAKDATMSPRAFALSFPRLSEFARYVDPCFSSSFWRRVAQ